MQLYDFSCRTFIVVLVAAFTDLCNNQNWTQVSNATQINWNILAFLFCRFVSAGRPNRQTNPNQQTENEVSAEATIHHEEQDIRGKARKSGAGRKEGGFNPPEGRWGQHTTVIMDKGGREERKGSQRQRGNTDTTDNSNKDKPTQQTDIS